MVAMKKRNKRPTLKTVSAVVRSSEDRIIGLGCKLESVRGDILAELRHARPSGEVNLDWKQRALDLMLEQANKTAMMEKPNNTTRLTWWQSVCARLAFRFQKMSGQYEPRWTITPE